MNNTFDIIYGDKTTNFLFNLILHVVNTFFETIKEILVLGPSQDLKKCELCFVFYPLLCNN